MTTEQRKKNLQAESSHTQSKNNVSNVTSHRSHRQFTPPHRENDIPNRSSQQQYSGLRPIENDSFDEEENTR